MYSLCLVVGLYVTLVTASRQLAMPDHGCSLIPTDESIPERVRDILSSHDKKLIRFNVIFSNYTVDPKVADGVELFKPNIWIRTANRRGKNLLMLDDEFEVYSLGLLSYGIEDLDVKLTDWPPGCVHELNTTEWLMAMRFLLMNDFKNSTEVSQWDEYEQVCNRRLSVPSSQMNDSYRIGVFTYECCQKDDSEEGFVCSDIEEDSWIAIIKKILFWGMLLGLSFYPLLLVNFMNMNYTCNTLYRMFLTNGHRLYINKGTRRLYTKELKEETEINSCTRSEGFHKQQDTDVSNLTVSVPRGALLPKDSNPVSVTKVLYDVLRCKCSNSEMHRECCYPTCCCCCKWYIICRCISILLLAAVISIPSIIMYVVYSYYLEDTFHEKDAVCERLHAICVDNLQPNPPSSHFVGLSITLISGIFVLRTGSKSSLTKRYLQMYNQFRPINFLTKAVKGFISLFTCNHCNLNHIGQNLKTFFLALFYVFASLFVAVPYIRIIIFILVMTPFVFMKIRESEERVSIFHFLVFSLFLIMSSYWIFDCIEFFMQMIFYCIIGIVANSDKTISILTILIPLCIYTNQILQKISKPFSEYDNLIRQILIYDSDIYKNINLAAMLNRSDHLVPYVKNFSRGNESIQVSEKGVYEYQGNNILIFYDLKRKIDSHESVSAENTVGDIELSIHTSRNLFFHLVDRDFAGGPGLIRNAVLKGFLRWFIVIALLLFIALIVTSLGSTYKVSLTNQFLITIVGAFIPFLVQIGLFDHKGETVDTGDEELKTNITEAIQNYTETWDIVEPLPEDTGQSRSINSSESDSVMVELNRETEPLLPRTQNV